MHSYRWPNWDPRYSYATVTRPSDEDQSRDRSVQSTGETERGGVLSDQLPRVPERPGEATASASASLGTRCLTTSSTSPEPPAANSGTRPMEVASSSTWDPWAQAAASSDRTPEPPVTTTAQPWWQDVSCLAFFLELEWRLRQGRLFGSTSLARVVLPSPVDSGS